jgi:hypothetical protein
MISTLRSPDCALPLESSAEADGEQDANAAQKKTASTGTIHLGNATTPDLHISRIPEYPAIQWPGKR